jgi:tetraacyldisaccharide 4'-kinase
MNAFSEIALAPPGALYGAVMRVRRALYRGGTLASYRIEAPVISVGNITTGGSGKTPLVEWIARSFAREGKHPCVLTRGYGRLAPHQRVLVSDGERILADALEGGDEPRLLAEDLLGAAAIISDRDRVAAARWAAQNLQSDLFILDDGFQHLRIKRDLDLVTVDAMNPFGGGKLLPRGRLREPLSTLACADGVVITRADMIADSDGLRARLQSLSKGQPVMLSRVRTSRVRMLPTIQASNKLTSANSLPQTLAAFCAIGNSQAFFAHLTRDGHSLIYTRSFRDHHIYTQADADMLAREAQACGALALVTTAKDAVKLNSLSFQIPCYVAEIEIEFEDESRLTNLLQQAIHRAAQHAKT